MWGILSVGSFGLIGATSPAIQSRPVDHFMLETAGREQLRADADPEERLAAPAHRLFQRLDHAGDMVEPAPAVGEGADARQHDVLGRKHVVWPRGDFDLAR